MTETPSTHRAPKGRVLRLPRRKGLWLFGYDQVKYETSFQHTVAGILGLLALGASAIIVWAMWSRRTGTWMDVLLAAAALAYGLVNAPVGVISWIRRRRGEATEYFDYEIVDQDKERRGKGSNHAPDHR